MSNRIFKVILPAAFVAVLGLSSCNDTDKDKDHDNRGNHATDPAQPSDSEYPGSKLNDSIHSDSTGNR